MFEWFAVALAAIAIYLMVYMIIWCYDNNSRHEDEEREMFEEHRRIRQAEFDRHAQAVARAELIETCETIYIGRWQHDGN